jgi:hypothetical protein
MDKARGNNRHMEVLLVERMAINLPPTPTHTAAHPLAGMAPAQIHMEAAPKVHMGNSRHHINHPIQLLKRQGMASHRGMVNPQATVRLQGMANMEVTRLQVI